MVKCDHARPEQCAHAATGCCACVAKSHDELEGKLQSLVTGASYRQMQEKQEEDAHVIEDLKRKLDARKDAMLKIEGMLLALQATLK